MNIWEYERGYPQVLNGVVPLRASYGEGFAKKGFSGAGFPNRAIGPDIAPCQGLNGYCGVILGCKQGHGKIVFLS